jgi:hypothetical protein
MPKASSIMNESIDSHAQSYFDYSLLLELSKEIAMDCDGQRKQSKEREHDEVDEKDSDDDDDQKEKKSVTKKIRPVGFC